MEKIHYENFWYFVKKFWDQINNIMKIKEM